MILKENSSINLNGALCKVKNLLGDGGQGEVYLVEYNGKNMALKMYKDKPEPEFVENLKNNIAKGAPADTFLWPKQYVEAESHSGYLMDLRPSNYASFVSYLTGKTIFADLRTLLLWCVKLCQSFKKLHEMGFSYQDLNDGSFFFDPDTGDLLICDNDNVTADKYNLGVLGKMRYMAPEIVRGEAMPDTHTDRFSLAVILFLALMKGYPFEGERLADYNIVDEEAEKRLFGTDPLFIYHKLDASNRPIRGYHTPVIKRWPTLPIYIKEAFHKTFVDGLTDRENGRVTELEWIRLLSRFSDELITCPCGYQFIYGFEEDKKNSSCPHCGAALRSFAALHVGKRLFILEPGKKLFKTHIDKYSDEYTAQIGEVIASKKNPAIWGIKLQFPHEIVVKDSTGVEKTIPADGVIPIVNHLKIKFDESTIGEIIREN